MKVLETERLIIRKFRIEDLEDFYQYAKSPNVGPDAGWSPHKSIDESREILTAWLDYKDGIDDEIGAIVLKEENKVIGSIGLHLSGAGRPEMAGCRMMGYVLSEDYWGRGIMTEASKAVIEYAFEYMKLDILVIDHFEFNVGSKRVIEKCGFTYEGMLRHAAPVATGKIHDICVYSMLRSEYLIEKAKRLGLRLCMTEEIEETQFMEFYTEMREASTRKYIIPMAADLDGNSFDEWKKKTIESQTIVSETMVPATTYFLCDDTGYIYGASNIRHRLNDRLLLSGGHIGYGVKPSERQKGYASIMLALSLEKSRDIGIKEVLLVCNDDNIASAKTIESCGGVMENKVMDGTLMRRYWIQVM